MIAQELLGELETDLSRYYFLQCSLQYVQVGLSEIETRITSLRSV